MKQVRLSIGSKAAPSLSAFRRGGAALLLVTSVFAWPMSASAANDNPAEAVRNADKPQVDLTATIRPREAHQQPGRVFTLGATVSNDGSDTAKPVRVVFNLAAGFTNVRVTEAPGFSCAVETIGTERPPGHLVTCSGGQIADDRDTSILMQANAPRTAGRYDVLAIVDPLHRLDELDEGNNVDQFTYEIQH